MAPAVTPLLVVEEDDAGAQHGNVNGAAAAAFRSAGKRVLRRVLLLAAVSGAALLYGGASDWTSSASEDFGAGAGVLLGLGAAAVPAAVVGLFVAYGPGTIDGRNKVGFGLLTLLPALALLGCVAPTLVSGADMEGHQLGAFFGLFAALIAGLATHFLFYLVGAANASPLVPGSAAATLGTLFCVFVMVPVGVYTPMALFKANGDLFDVWFGSVGEEDHAASARPPLLVAPALAVPYVTVLALLHPLIRVSALNLRLYGSRPEAPASTMEAIRRVGCLRRPFRTADALLVGNGLATVPLCFARAEAPARLALGALLLATPWALTVAARLAAADGEADAVWRRATIRFVAPVFGLGLIALNAAQADVAGRAWYGPLAITFFGAAAVVAASLCARFAARRFPPRARFHNTMAFVGLVAVPWWGFVLASHAAKSAELAVLSLAAVAPAGVVAVLDALHARSQREGGAPARYEVFAIIPHLLLILALCYVGLNATLVRFKAGGLGVLACTALFAPVATHVGLDEVRRRSDGAPRRPLYAWPPRSGRERLLFLSPWPAALATAASALTGFAPLAFEKGSLLSEAKGGALWLLVAAPAAALGWDAVYAAAAAWRAQAGGSHEHVLTRVNYYARLLDEAKGGRPQTAGEADEETKASSRFWRNALSAEIAPREAMPIFSAMLCCLVLVPFGVLAPLFFLSKSASVVLFTKSQLMGLLVAAVFAFVTIVTTSANASMDRIKGEARSKVASYALRLALRKVRVVASVPVARLLYEERAHHVACAVAALEKQKKTGKRHRALAEDAADRALADDLRDAKHRMRRVEDCEQRALAEAAEAPAAKAGAVTPNAVVRFTGKIASAWGESPTAAVHDAPATPVIPAALAEFDLATAADACADDRRLVFWRSTKREPSCMDLAAVATIVAGVRTKHDAEVARLRAKQQRVAAREGAVHARETAKANLKSALDWIPDEEDLTLEPPAWFVNLFSCFAKKPEEAVEPAIPAATPIDVKRKRRFEAADPAGCAAARTGARAAVAACVALLEERVLVDGRGDAKGLLAALDDALAGRDTDLGERLTAAERKTVARARWRLVAAAIPTLVTRRWRLRKPSKESTAGYRAALLPRAFCGYASANGGAAMVPEDWRSFLKAAGVLGDGERKVSYLKADLVFTSLARVPRDAPPGQTKPMVREDLCLDYRSFRQAMRQAAVALYPQLPEADALKLLGQKHIFPNVRLATKKRARDARVLVDKGGAKPGGLPRLLDVLEREKGRERDAAQLSRSRAALEAARTAAAGGKGGAASPNRGDPRGEKAASAAGAAYGRALRESRGAFEAARAGLAEATAMSARERDMAEESSDDESAVDVNEALAEAEAKAEIEAEADAKARRGCGWNRAKKFLLEALDGSDAQTDDKAMELELLRAGAKASEKSAEEALESGQPPPDDWDAAVSVCIQSLRQSADAAVEAEKAHKTRGVKVVKNVDNAFALLDLVIEVVTFMSLGLKGSGGYAWGTTRACEFDKGGCPAPKTPTQERQSALTRLAGLPLLTIQNLNTMQVFWISVVFCFLTPIYLLKAVRLARAQTIGLGPGGAKLKLLSRDWFYFQGIKVAQAGLAPVMATLFSAFVCDTCEPEPKFLSRMAVRCGSFRHVGYVTAGLLACVAYYPVITYLQPQLQFKSKALDLKFEPTYLVVVAQCKLALSVVVNFWSEDRSRRCGGDSGEALRNGFQLLIISAGLASFLALHTLMTAPCIVPSFNVARAVSLGGSAAFLWASAANFWLQDTSTFLRLSKTAARTFSGIGFVAFVAAVNAYGRRRARQLAEADDAEDDDSDDEARSPRDPGKAA